MLLDAPHGKFDFTKAASSLKVCFLCRGLLTVANLALSVLSFGRQLHSFWLWTCVCVMLLRKMHFKQKWLKVILKQ
ncbi:hypothetical protein ATY37_20475 [Vibrio cidicii]|uniref:Uncharacterized protein n=1 Tax=Vibrio cidicii TaxID=1763883 RepID=A0A151KUD3_9VIBR|nr:hypothetical protein ATY37_20475 [Vibrio cidicii]